MTFYDFIRKEFNADEIEAVRTHVRSPLLRLTFPKTARSRENRPLATRR